MKKSLVILSVIVLVGIVACKKEEEFHACPAIARPSVSIKAEGDDASGVLVVIYNKVEDSYNNAQCSGTFMEVVGSGGTGDPDSLVFFYKVINDPPDSVITHPNFTNTEWLVDLRYLGVGLECYVDAHLVDPKTGIGLETNDVELVEITHIEPYF